MAGGEERVNGDGAISFTLHANEQKVFYLPVGVQYELFEASPVNYDDVGNPVDPYLNNIVNSSNHAITPMIGGGGTIISDYVGEDFPQDGYHFYDV